ncbi:MAG: hypothetical protein HPY57_13605 [Ignavibacteria bacterium]|nr:hypothetical protein [Ignavibacteria bacterium]
MKYLKKYENPDFVNASKPRYVSTDFSDVDALAFGYDESGKMLINFGTHNDIMGTKENDGRLRMYFPGRLWINQKIISFWKYPTVEKLPQVLKDIQDTFNSLSKEERKYTIIDKNNEKKEHYFDDIDFSDKEWLIEVLDEDLYDPNNIEWDTDTILIPLSDYVGSKERDKEELMIPHLANWSEKQALKAKGFGRGFGSDLTAWDSKNPLAWRQAKYQESIITKFKKFETCDGIYIDGNIEVDFNDSDVFPFLIYNNNVYIGFESETHEQVYDYYSIPYNNAIEGRVYLKEKIISFWNLEYINNIEKVFKMVGKEFEVDLFDGEWRIDVFISKNSEFEQTEEYKKLAKKYYVYKSYFWYALIPIKDFLSNTWNIEDDSEQKAIHLLNWREKQELKKKGWGRGWVSDLTAWDGKNPLWWRQLKYQENKIY